MELNSTKTFKVGEMVFYAKRTNRAIIDFESLFNKKLTDVETTEDRLKFFFCCAKAGFKSAGEAFDYTFEQFLDLVDDYPNETFQGFMEALYSPDQEPEDPSKKK